MLLLVDIVGADVEEDVADEVAEDVADEVAEEAIFSIFVGEFLIDMLQKLVFINTMIHHICHQTR